MRRDRHLVGLAILPIFLVLAVSLSPSRADERWASERTPTHVERVAQHAAGGASKATDGTSPRSIPRANELSHIAFSGGDGKDCDNAVVIEHAKNTAEGTAAERAWLSAVYPDGNLRTTALVQRNKKSFELIEIATRESVIRVCFDISDFFGKW